MKDRILTRKCSQGAYLTSSFSPSLLLSSSFHLFSFFVNSMEFQGAGGLEPPSAAPGSAPLPRVRDAATRGFHTASCKATKEEEKYKDYLGSVGLHSFVVVCYCGCLHCKRRITVAALDFGCCSTGKKKFCPTNP